jgi:hypothetical protein
MKVCSIERCTHKAAKRSWCQTHYTRWLRHGNPTFTKVEMHGLANTHEYEIWREMKYRCTKTNHKWYPSYGGRGIKVCDRWMNSFKAFYEDMGAKPDGYSIDRIDNDGNYEPENCRWVTMKEQATHRRLTRDSLGRWKSLTRKRGYSYQSV